MKDNTIALRTTSFSAERGSILHSGIFNRELAASLAAGAMLLMAGFFFASRGSIGIGHFLAGIPVFAVLFIFFRTYLFSERVLETVLDREKKTITLSLIGKIGTRKQQYHLSDFCRVTMREVTLEPENSDGIRVVEKVALQHGTVLPGFGKREEFYSVQLDFRTNSVTIFSTRVRSEAETMVSELNGYLGGHMPCAGAAADMRIK